MSIQIGIWGGPQAGKTTYLAALHISALLEARGSWSINGRDEDYAGSTEFLAEATNKLRKGEFPYGATEDPATYAYQITGSINADFLGQILGTRRDVDFNLLVKDYPGGSFATPDPQDEIWKFLASCQGLVYLFDPCLESTSHDNFEYTSRAILYIKVQKRSQLVNGRLPHYLIICLSKYDDPATYQWLLEHQLLTTRPDDLSRTPVVLNPKRAIELWDPLLLKHMENNFMPGRIG